MHVYALKAVFGFYSMQSSNGLIAMLLFHLVIIIFLNFEKNLIFRYLQNVSTDPVILTSIYIFSIYCALKGSVKLIFALKTMSDI